MPFFLKTMLKINDLIVKIQTISNLLPKIVDVAVNANQQKIVQGMIQKRLFSTGVKGDGTNLPPYAPITIERKDRSGRNLPTGHMTLFEHGDFYKGMFAKSNNAVIFINSSASITSELESRYGDSIMDLTEEEQEQIIMKMVDPEIEKILNDNAVYEIEI